MRFRKTILLLLLTIYIPFFFNTGAAAENNSPVLDHIGDKTVNEGELLQFTINATDPDSGDTLTFSATNLPDGASFDSGTRTFSWTPNYSQAGSYPGVHFEVQDAAGLNSSEDITITVTDANRAPVLESIGDKTVNEGELLQFTINGTDPDGDTLTYSATNLPKGASFDPATRTFSWTPDYKQEGSHSGVHFEVEDSGGLKDGRDITITVTNANRAPVLDSIGDRTVNEGELLQFSINATDPDGDALTFSATNLPDGAGFSSATRTFSWTPNYNQAGSYPGVHFEVQDSAGLKDGKDITITVTNANRAPVLDAIGDKTVNEGELLQFIINATDPDGDALTYSATNLPKGANFDPASRTFSWTPDYKQEGSHSGIHFEVKDSGGLKDGRDITITVTNTNRAPVLDTIGDRTVNEGELLQFIINATDPDGDALTYSATNLPYGANFDSGTRTFSWTPNYTQAGSYSGVHFEVQDSYGLKDSKEITISVNNVNRAPPVPIKIAPINWQNLSDGNIRLIWNESKDPDGDSPTYEWELSNQPDFSVIVKKGTTPNLFSDLFLPSNPYYWRIRANDSFLVSAWSQSSTTPDFQIVSAPGISNVKASILTANSIKIEWATNQSDSLNRVKYGYKEDLVDGLWSNWGNTTNNNVAIIIEGLTGQLIYYQAFSYNAGNSSARSNSSIMSFSYPLYLDMKLIEPDLINNNGTWIETRRPASVGHQGKFIGIDGTFTNTGEDPLTINITDNPGIYCEELCTVTLSKGQNLSFMDAFSGRRDFEINSSEIKWTDKTHGFFSYTFNMNITGSGGSTFTYQNTTNLSLPIFPIFRMKRADGDIAAVIAGGTTIITYTLEANSSINLINVSIFDPMYLANQGGPYFNISKLEANKSTRTNYTYQATTNDLSSNKFKCEEGYPCIINMATFTGMMESGELINDTDYVEIPLGVIPLKKNTGGGGSTSTGGGGGGGGGGIPPSEDFKNIEAREVREKDILAKSAVTYTFKAADPVMAVAFESEISDNGVPVAVEVLKNRSKKTAVDAPGMVFKNFNVFVGTSGFNKKIRNGVVVFRVNNTWLEDNGLDPTDISLFKWYEGAWIEKSTEIAESKPDYTYYASLVGNFSNFAISGNKKQVSSSGQALGISVPQNESGNNTNQTLPGSGSGIIKSPVGFNLIIGIMPVIGIIGLIYYLKIRNQKKPIK